MGNSVDGDVVTSLSFVLKQFSAVHPLSAPWRFPVVFGSAGGRGEVANVGLSEAVEPTTETG